MDCPEGSGHLRAAWTLPGGGGLAVMGRLSKASFAAPQPRRTASYARPPRREAVIMGHPDRDLFVVKGFRGFSWGPASGLFACAGRRAAGWYRAREWLVRRAGFRGVSRPRWSQSRSPAALPGPR